MPFRLQTEHIHIPNNAVNKHIFGRKNIIIPTIYLPEPYKNWEGTVGLYHNDDLLIFRDIEKDDLLSYEIPFKHYQHQRITPNKAKFFTYQITTETRQNPAYHCSEYIYNLLTSIALNKPTIIAENIPQKHFDIYQQYAHFTHAAKTLYNLDIMSTWNETNPVSTLINLIQAGYIVGVNVDEHTPLVHFDGSQLTLEPSHSAHTEAFFQDNTGNIWLTDINTIMSMTEDQTQKLLPLLLINHQKTFPILFGVSCKEN